MCRTIKMYTLYCIPRRVRNVRVVSQDSLQKDRRERIYIIGES